MVFSRRISRTNANMTPSDIATHPGAAVLQSLIQLRDVLADLSPDAYTFEADRICRGTVGRHVRHCLDHVRMLLDAAPTGLVDYDARDRGTDIETDAAAACEELDRLCAALRDGDLPLDQPLTISSVISGAGDRVTTQSSLGRELVYVLAHTIHHAAMILGLIEAAGGDVPETFGYAPSTIASDQCAR